MREWLKPEHLSIVNAVLDQDPALRKALTDALQIAVATEHDRLTGMRACLTGLGGVNTLPPPAPPAVPLAEKWPEGMAGRILRHMVQNKRSPSGAEDWTLTELRHDLGITDANEDEFKKGITNNRNHEFIVWNGKRGTGTAYRVKS